MKLGAEIQTEKQLVSCMLCTKLFHSKAFLEKHIRVKYSGENETEEMKNYLWKHKSIKTCQQVVHSNDGNFSQRLYWSSGY